MKRVKVNYYTERAAKSAQDKIRELIPKIGSIPGNYLNYTDARAVISFLADYADLLEKAAQPEEDTQNVRKEIRR